MLLNLQGILFSQRQLLGLFLALGWPWVCVASGCEARPPRPVPTVNPPPPARAVGRLVLEQALPVDGPGRFQPSGLLFQAGRLFAVSDKHEQQLFELRLESDRARAVVARRFALPSGSGLQLDWEGMTAGASGAVLLVSEARHRVLRLEPEGGSAAGQWVTPSLRPLARTVGCLRLRNAGLEGLALLPNGKLLLAAEREPRGVLEWSLSADPSATQGRAWAWPSAAAGPFGRRPDVGDLAVTDSGGLYALLRGEHLVARLLPQAGGYGEAGAWSFADTENEPRHRYRDMRYGRAEGLAFGPQQVFIVLDNNGDARQLDPSDRRPLLFVFSRPRDLR